MGKADAQAFTLHYQPIQGEPIPDYELEDIIINYEEILHKAEQEHQDQPSSITGMALIWPNDWENSRKRHWHF